MNRDRLIVLTRFPIPGTTKTRLIPALGPEGASDLHARMVEYTVGAARVLEQKCPGLLEICYAGGEAGALRKWLGPDLRYTPQGSGDLGRRMTEALDRNFGKGDQRIVLIGTDCPGITAAHLESSFTALRGHDVVLGPSLDGGYYLIGMRRLNRILFEGISWGSDKVQGETLEKSRAAGLSVKLLNPLQDVDTPDDLQEWEKTQGQTLSIVIPTLNEEGRIRETLSHAAGIEQSERIVVDGGSQDRTVEKAQAEEARVLVFRPGRGPQLNHGAKASSGAILLFLHADTLLPPDAGRLIRSALLDPAVVGGYFRLRFQPRSPLLCFQEWTINLRTRVLKRPYGDQAYFVRASVFALAGGFPDIPIMEDVEFIRRLLRLGKLVLLPASVVTSARRFVQRGIVRTTLRNKITILGYRFGVSPDKLAHWYYRGTAQDPYPGPEQSSDTNRSETDITRGP